LWGHERRSRPSVRCTLDSRHAGSVCVAQSAHGPEQRPPYSTRMSRRPDAPGYEVSASLTCLSKKVGPFGAKRKCVAACKNSF
jgi:hypothetical protein